eukprot:CAMPEP_0203754804 /NCGR_PEP_ID=MMETSP0098-20131031/8363_1 /ASSEMBLY_ACC=CAM_ASM_000208 /TAXON_ID=96639 /ORGANISM=" , Strain NY0313808BC1" /LENGTH=1004 /DNA_ID=CAMNT_0050646003 /DNA_START=471 /DNA_END=3482 /DNA_ORIENTATION=-
MEGFAEPDLIAELPSPGGKAEAIEWKMTARAEKYNLNTSEVTRDISRIVSNIRRHSIAASTQSERRQNINTIENEPVLPKQSRSDDNNRIHFERKQPERIRLRISERKVVFWDIMDLLALFLLMCCVVTQVVLAFISDFEVTAQEASEIIHPDIIKGGEVLLLTYCCSTFLNLSVKISRAFRWYITTYNRGISTQPGKNRAEGNLENVVGGSNGSTPGGQVIEKICFELHIARTQKQQVVLWSIFQSIIGDVVFLLSTCVKSASTKSIFPEESRECFRRLHNATASFSNNTKSDAPWLPTVCLSSSFVGSCYVIVICTASICYKLSLLRGGFSRRNDVNKYQRLLDQYTSKNISPLDSIVSPYITDSSITRTMRLRRFLVGVYGSKLARCLDDFTLHALLMKNQNEMVTVSAQVDDWLAFREEYNLDELQKCVSLASLELSGIKHYSTVSKYVKIVDNFTIDPRGSSMIIYMQIERDGKGIDSLFEELSVEELLTCILSMLERQRMVLQGLMDRAKVLLHSVFLIDGRIAKGSTTSIGKLREIFSRIATVAYRFPVLPTIILWSPSPFMEQTLNEFGTSSTVIVVQTIRQLSMHVNLDFVSESIGGNLCIDEWCPAQEDVMLRTLQASSVQNSQLHYVGSFEVEKITITENTRLLIGYLIGSKLYGEETLLKSVFDVVPKRLFETSQELRSWSLQIAVVLINLKKSAKNMPILTDTCLSSISVARYLQSTEWNVLDAISLLLTNLRSGVMLKAGPVAKFHKSIISNNSPVSSLFVWERLCQTSPINPFVSIDVKNHLLISVLWSQAFSRMSLKKFRDKLDPICEYINIVAYDMSMHYGVTFQVMAFIKYDHNTTSGKEHNKLMSIFQRMSRHYPGLFYHQIQILYDTANTGPALLAVHDKLSEDNPASFTCLGDEESVKRLRRHVSANRLPACLGGTSETDVSLEALLHRQHPSLSKLKQNLIGSEPVLRPTVLRNRHHTTWVKGNRKRSFIGASKQWVSTRIK